MAVKLDEDYYDSEDVDLSKNDQKKLENERNAQANAQNLRNAADIAMATGNPYAEAIGGGVKLADQLTDGKSTELLGHAMNLSNKIQPLGGLSQKASNFAAESGLGDIAGDVASYKNKFSGDNPGAKGEAPNQVKKPGIEGGEQKGSLPSSADKENKNLPQKPGEGEAGKKEAEAKQSRERTTSVKDTPDKGRESDKEDEFGMKSPFKITFAQKVGIILLVGTPFFVMPLLILIVFSGVLGMFSTFDDGFGMSYTQGTDTGGVVFYASSQEQQDFYNRVLEVRNNYLAEGKNVNPLKIVAVYSILKDRGAPVSYQSMTVEAISDIADCMFLNGVYSDDTFRNNLITYLIPKYLPDTLDEERATIAESIFEWEEMYYKIIGKNNSSSCSDVGTCTYTISGFHIGSSNIRKDLNINDLYVRLMQCGVYGSHDYGGTWGVPMEGEELVPFEKYVLGVAYAEIGPGAPEHAFKAQMIASRSFALARATEMHNATPWRSLEQEADGKWVLQVASCTADQVYCDPDQGCSTTAGGNGQWNQVHSGTGAGRTIKGPIAQDSELRQYAADVQGEVLVNNQGYVIETGYLAAESNQFSSLARSGLDYKQILLQVYNQGSRAYGAYDISKASCGNCVSNGSYASWKQYEGEWVNVQLGSSGKTIKQIGCLATSLAIQVARSGVQTNISNFNPGTFVETLSQQGAFSSGGALNSYASVAGVAPSFVYENYIDLSGMSRQNKLNTISNIVNQQGVYAVAEVKGNTGQHWVAIDSVSGDTITMMDPGSSATDMWSQYDWNNTSRIVYYRVS